MGQVRLIGMAARLKREAILMRISDTDTGETCEIRCSGGESHDSKQSQIEEPRTAAQGQVVVDLGNQQNLRQVVASPPRYTLSSHILESTSIDDDE